MKIFISWSGVTSHKIALTFKEWLPYIFPITDFYLSSEDLRKGGRWAADLANELNETNFGIICLTKSNLTEQWILFEAGAISKQVKESFVCTVLFDLKPSEVEGPLAQFQATIIEKKEIFKLVQSINLALGDIKIREQILKKIFDKWWPDFKQKIDKIEPTQVEKSMKLPERNIKDMFEEILYLLRGSKRDMNKLKTIKFTLPLKSFHTICGTCNREMVIESEDTYLHCSNCSKNFHYSCVDEDELDYICPLCKSALEMKSFD